MNIRNKPIYLSHEVYSALRLIGQSRPARNDTYSLRTTTADEMADVLLRQVITEKYPQLFQFQKEVDAMERKLVESLK